MQPMRKVNSREIRKGRPIGRAAHVQDRRPAGRAGPKGGGGRGDAHPTADGYATLWVYFDGRTHVQDTGVGVVILDFKGWDRSVDLTWQGRP